MNQQQQNAYNTRYLFAYIYVLNEALEDIQNINHVETLIRLISTVTQSRHHYSVQSQYLSIAEGTAQQDAELLTQVQEILPNASQEEQAGVYQALYKLLHELRWNKCPDAHNIDEQNARLLARLGEHQREALYEQTIAKIGTISRRLGQDSNRNEITDEEIENIFLENILPITLKHIEDRIEQELAIPMENAMDLNNEIPHANKKEPYDHLSLEFRQYLSHNTVVFRQSLPGKPDNQAYWDTLNEKEQNAWREDYRSCPSL